MEADLGPVKYLAILLGTGDEDLLRYFILVVALLLDPARRAPALGSDADASGSAKAQDGGQGGRIARQAR